MEYQTIYNKENTRIKFLAFVIIMPAYIDVLNVLLNTIGIGMTSVVTACIYIYVLISLILKCGIRKIDFFYLIGFYLVFLLNYLFFSSTRSEMLSQGMIIVYIFFIPYGLFSFKNVVNWDSFFSYLYKYAKWAIISGGMMLLFLSYDKYLGYMDYSYSLLPAVCAAYYYQAKGKNIEEKKTSSFIPMIMFVAGIIEMAAFGARSGILYAVLFVGVLELLRKDISIQKKLLICGVLVIGGMIGVFYLDDILYLVSKLPYFENSYLVRSFLKGKLFNTDTRQVIWQSCFERLNTMGMDVTGFFGDRPYCAGAVYPHNIVLEILMSWGWIIGGCILAYLLWLIIRGLTCKGLKRDVCIFIIFSCLSRFFMSGTYIREGKFWITVFVLVALGKGKKKANN